MYPIVLLFLLLITSVEQVTGQFGEIASLVGGILSPALVGSATGGAASGAASAAANLLGGIGTLYQIAQGALQLTGTGVGILNQASEGKWFNTVLEGAMNHNREIQERALIGSGTGPDYAQLGTNFPAPEPGDYDHEEFIKPEGLISINSSSTLTDKSSITEIPVITLFPEETETNDPTGKENPKILMKNLVIDSTEAGKEEDRSSEEEKPKLGVTEIFSNYDNEVEKVDKESEIVEQKVAKLHQLIALLRESNLTESDLREMTRLLEKVQKMVKSKSSTSSTKHEFRTAGTAIPTTTFPLFIHAKQTSDDAAPITVPPVNFRRVKFDETTDNEDNDLLPATTARPRAKAVRIKWRPKNQPDSSSVLTTSPPRRQFPRRTAYTARLPFVTSTAGSAVTPTHQPERWDTLEKSLEIPGTQTKPTQFTGEASDLHPWVVHPKKLPSGTLTQGIRNVQISPNLPLTSSTPVPGVFPLVTPQFRPQPQTPNVFQPQSFYASSFGNSNNVPWSYQNPAYMSQTHFPAQGQYGQLNTYPSTNPNPSIPPSQNLNPAQTRYTHIGWSGR